MPASYRVDESSQQEQQERAACRDVVRRVWDWLEVSGSREQSLGLGSASDAVQFGQMHLSEGSPATTVITTALDASRCDAVEPCVSSLLDAQVRSLLRRRALPCGTSLSATTTALHLMNQWSMQN